MASGSHQAEYLSQHLTSGAMRVLANKRFVPFPFLSPFPFSSADCGQARALLTSWTSLLSESSKPRKRDSHLAGDIGDWHSVMFDQASHDLRSACRRRPRRLPFRNFVRDTPFFLHVPRHARQSGSPLRRFAHRRLSSLDDTPPFNPFDHDMMQSPGTIEPCLPRHWYVTWVVLRPVCPASQQRSHNPATRASIALPFCR
jgi:hypothetical protein